VAQVLQGRAGSNPVCARYLVSNQCCHSSFGLGITMNDLVLSFFLSFLCLFMNAFTFII
jgi:hypothetical protein